MTRVPALGRRSQAQVPGARSGTRPGPPAPQICNFLSPRSFPTACRHDGTVSPPEPHRSLSVAPLIGDKRCYGEATVRLRRGQAQDREWRGRTRLPQSVEPARGCGSRRFGTPLRAGLPGHNAPARSSQRMAMGRADSDFGLLSGFGLRISDFNHQAAAPAVWRRWRPRGCWAGGAAKFAWLPAPPAICFGR